MCLAFVVVSAMGETNSKMETTEIEKNLSQEERFNMLFGETTLQFNEIRKSRVNRSTRNSRKVVSHSVVTEDKVIEINTLSPEERYELLFEKTVLRKRVARMTRFTFPRQGRHSLYVSLNF